MSRVIVMVAAGLALAGCTSGGTGADLWPKYEPAPVSVQFQSDPAGAEAKTSGGQACKTPCSLAVAPDKDFAVTFSLAGYEPQTVPVQVSQPDGTEVIQESSLQPNPVAVELAKSSAKRPPAKKRATTASAAKPVTAKPAAARPARPAAAPAAPAEAPPALDPWPQVR
jgi:hypothetical protein